jgi:methionine-rich copper-binding protein CopC
MLFLAAALLAAAPAAATATTGQPALLHSDPAHGAETRGMPTAVRLRFNQPMRLERLKVYDGEGAEQVVRLSRDAATPALEQRGGLIRLRPGAYRVEWAASSPRGETVSGTLFFHAKEREQQQQQQAQR